MHVQLCIIISRIPVYRYTVYFVNRVIVVVLFFFHPFCFFACRIMCTWIPWPNWLTEVLHVNVQCAFLFVILIFILIRVGCRVIVWASHTITGIMKCFMFHWSHIVIVFVVRYIHMWVTNCWLTNWAFVFVRGCRRYSKIYKIRIIQMENFIWKWYVKILNVCT